MNNEDEQNVEAYDPDALLQELEIEKEKSRNLNNSLHSQGLTAKDSNFVSMQIDPTELLDRLEHFYRGDVVGRDKDGNVGWLPQEDNDLKTFNEFGVASLMEIITKYIDKNTILSNYTETRIYEILADLGEDLILFMLCNYETIGMDTYFKKTKFRMVITTTTHMIESTYRRAMYGKTLQELNQSKIVTQHDHMRPIAQPAQTQKKGWLGKIGF